MKKNDIIHGFRVTETLDLPELDASMVRMVYEKNGAELIWLDRPDENKTFAITFKTIPQDDTGVFHILEHSVLCGSHKYPVKEPFVDLLKSSLQTFLNAMTFPDKTMYPVASRNDKDFLNLIDVYMDAVLHPLSIEDPHAFLQEGWHYELESPDDELICNGVVYNEMKGAFSSHEEILQFALNRQLFPDNCYGYESGGHPDHITELTYDNYLDSHRRYYHPSNSRIFLDGMVDVDAVLAKIDGFLGEYDMLDIDATIPMQVPVSPDEVEYEYEVSEDSDDQLILAEGWVYGDYRDRERTYALTILSEVLTGSNEAPLTKALLDKGLAVDVDLQVLDGIQQPYIVLLLRSTPVERRDEAWNVVKDTIRQIASDGVDRRMLHASLNKLEFLKREKDYGTMPRGLVYAIDAMDAWLYDGDPVQNIVTGTVFDDLRKMIDCGGIDALMEECLIKNAHHARVTLVPSATLGEERAERERSRLADVKAGWNADEISRIMNEFSALREKQGGSDRPEDKAKLPKLSLSDVPKEAREIDFEVFDIGNVKVIHPDVNTNGIIYLDMKFDISDLTVEELSIARVLAKLIGDIATTNYSVNELQAEIDANLGRLDASVSAQAEAGVIDTATPYFNISISLLEDKKADALRLLNEVLNESQFTDSEYILNEIKQARIAMEQSVISEGNSYARQRVASGKSVLGMLTESLFGIDHLRYIQALEDGFDEKGGKFCNDLEKIFSTIFSRDRLTVGLTGPTDENWIAELMDILHGEKMAGTASYVPSDRPNAEGFRIPAPVSYTAKGTNLYSIDDKYSGSLAVAATILTYGYLWNTIRVQGGAYGTGLRVATTGDVSYSSFRDPSGDRSLTSYDGASDALRGICQSGEDLDSYVISTIGSMEPLLTPRMEGKKVISQYMTGQSREDRARIRAEVLGTGKDELLAIADQLDKVTKNAAVCIIGGSDIIDACGDMLDAVENIQ